MYSSSLGCRLSTLTLNLKLWLWMILGLFPSEFSWFSWKAKSDSNHKWIIFNMFLVFLTEITCCSHTKLVNNCRPILNNIWLKAWTESRKTKVTLTYPIFLSMLLQTKHYIILCLVLITIKWHVLILLSCKGF